MIDATDFTIPGTGVLRNKLGITDPAALSKATADSTALRLAELHASPVRGGFDSTHLQAIHHYIYQDLYDWAGELRPIDAGNVPASQVEKSLNSVLDCLSRENYLKGLSGEEWSRSASAYIYDLGTIQPFLAGNQIALQEFAVELARKNNLSLQWDATPDIASDSIALLSQAEQSANLRRLIMLAMDTGPITQHSCRDHILEQGIERLFPSRMG
ncbi:MAG: Fic family protein [Terracidiphilus sp.]|jgi:fido (protein-threonine AMPylation protein)